MNLSFVKYVQKNSFVLKYVLPRCAQYPLAYKMGKGRALIATHPMHMYFLLGLEKFLNFPRSPRSPEVSKGSKLGSSSMGSSRARTSLLADILLERRAVLGGAQHYSVGSEPYWAVRLTIWLSASWTLDLT